MATSNSSLLKAPVLNGWKLFLLVTILVSLVVIVQMFGTDYSTAAGVSSLIQLSVRCAVPLLYLVFAASSVHVLMPSDFSRWLLRNRKYFGLCFASAMAWQGFFILWMVGIHTDYYVGQVYVLSDAIEGVVGYTALLLMVITSFKFGRKQLTGKQWRYLHKFGIYYLWAYAWSVYWFALYYYNSPNSVDYVYYWSGLLAWGLRAGAWSKQQSQNQLKQNAKLETA
jgi:hypothetical protein